MRRGLDVDVPQTVPARVTGSLLVAPRGDLTRWLLDRPAAKFISNVELPTLPLLALLWDCYVGVFVSSDLEVM